MHEFEDLKRLFLDYLEDNSFDKEPVNLYEPINYIMGIGGKRIRPVACLIACNLYTDDVSNALPLAYGLEMFHNFTLAHDDVMDEAEMRRGKAAMHIKYGLNSAVLSGDTMLIYAYQYILESSFGPAVKDSILKIFSDTAIDICAGQQMDMDFESQDEVELSEYLLMIKRKTAVLLGACLQIGALAGGASKEDAEHLYLYGLNIGLAFQIKDDMLDLYAEEGFGKKTGGDIMQKKKTYLYLKALELADKNKRKELVRIYNDDFLIQEQKVKTVKAIFDELEIQNHARHLMEELTENAMDHLNALKIGRASLSQLNNLSQLLLSRTN